ncbi:hypothetical protein PCL_00782 [Purpureocillium lilacinum]|uniref:Uncharacterized protein n=1 Tax=Purpureocillium lilacinum TaxID=33203 RepID=A0A2U3E5T3_PURLI|nr:hypothetical protein PCL_00782 [Purpureocillium lilacinum]
MLQYAINEGIIECSKEAKEPAVDGLDEVLASRRLGTEDAKLPSRAQPQARQPKYPRTAQLPCREKAYPATPGPSSTPPPEPGGEAQEPIAPPNTAPHFDLDGF